MIRALAPLMIAAKSGHIVNISSLAGHNPLLNGAAYSASKCGLNGLTYSVAEELREHNVRVSVVAPGSVNTGFGRSSKNSDKKGPAGRCSPRDSHAGNAGTTIVCKRGTVAANAKTLMTLSPAAWEELRVDSRRSACGRRRSRRNWLATQELHGAVLGPAPQNCTM
jgi:short-subunit dehydrogenase